MLLNNGEDKAPVPDRQKGFYEDFKEFTTETTSHGIKYVFHAAYRFVRAIYFLLWIMAVGYTIYIVFDSISKYANMDTGTKIEQTIMPSIGIKEAISHPTITVCPHNMISKEYLDANPGLEDLYSEFHHWEESGINFDEEPYSKYRNLTYHEVIWNGRPRQGRGRGFLQCSHYRHLCETIDPFNGTDKEHWEWETTLSGACYRINPRGEIFTQVGDYGVLKLYFFADLLDYSDFAKKEPQYGYIVTFHDNGTYSSTATSGFYMSPGNIYKADLRKIEEENIGPPAGDCNPHVTQNTYGTYSINSCNAKCRDDYVMSKCGCVQIEPPHDTEGKYKSCTLEQWAKCGQQAQKHWVDNFVDLKVQENTCNCHSACKEISYSATISSSRLSKYYAEDKKYRLPSGYNKTAENVYENLMVLEVMFTKIKLSQYQQYLKYSVNDLIGSVGGQMGMLLGASMFTIIEFIHFFVKAFWRYCIRSRQDRQPVYVMHTDATS